MIISIDKVTKWYGSQLVLHELSYDLSEPAIIALVTPNGSGKTTLLNIMCGIEQASSGTVELFNKAPSWQQFLKVSYMQDNSVLFGHLTGLDHLQFVADNYQLDQAAIYEVANSLKMVDYLKKKVKHYSLGMKQQLLFALAILPKPDLLLLDEPLNGLDPASIVRVRELMLQLHVANQTTIIFSSHNLDQIDKLTDHIIFLKEGELVEPELALTNYSFVVADVTLLSHYFESHDLPYALIGEYKISSRLEKSALTQLESYCQSNQLTIFDRTEQKIDTESLYFELYQEEEDGD